MFFRSVSAGRRRNASDSPFHASLLASIQDKVTVLSPSGAIAYTNWDLPCDGEDNSIEFSDCIHPDDLSAFQSLRANCATDSASTTFHLIRLRNANNEWRWHECQALCRATDPSIAGLVIIAKDIHTIKTAQERYDRAAKIARFGFMSFNPDTGEFNWGNGLSGLLDILETENAKGRDLSWVERNTHPGDLEKLYKAVEEARKDGLGFSSIVRFKGFDGDYLYLQLEGFAEKHSNNRITGIWQDVTQKEKSKAKLEASEERHRSLVENVSDIILRQDKNGKILHASPAAYAILGYRPEDVHGSPAEMFLHPEFLSAAVSAYAKASKTRNPVVFTCPCIAKDGREIWLELSIQATIDPAGDVMEYMVVGRDYSDRKAMEEELVKQRIRAEQANASKSAFLANMSHELRTPLNAILGFSEVIKDEVFGSLNSERYVEYATLIHDSGEHLLGLINGILDVSKIEAGKYELALETIYLESLVPSCVQMVESAAEKRAISIHQKLDPDSLHLTADGRAIRQVILNLLSNAVKFTDPGGHVTVSSSRKNNWLTLSVSDTGCGIRPEDLDGMFRPFEQAAEGKSANEGTGLGLTLVRSLTELHGGRARIESTLGEGTTVYVDLPLSNTDQMVS